MITKTPDIAKAYKQFLKSREVLYTRAIEVAQLFWGQRETVDWRKYQTDWLEQWVQVYNSAPALVEFPLECLTVKNEIILQDYAPVHLDFVSKSLLVRKVAKPQPSIVEGVHENDE